MRLVVKIGGAALEDATSRATVAAGVAELARGGHEVAVVHGGGARLTRTLQQMGKASTFVDGLRVTDAETRDVALMVLAGFVNKQLVQALHSAGARAVGLCGGDGGSFRARKWMPNGAELGFVGEICAADPGWMEAVWGNGGVPVLTSLAPDANGEYYNVNADAMASACAAACRAEALVFLTDVTGVRDAAGAVMTRLALGELPALQAAGVVSGGMLPKLKACADALHGGVARVRIAPASAAGQISDWIFAADACGTEVTA